MINADPDAIASAMAVKRLLWRKTAKVVICSISGISRPDNIAMVDYLGVKILKPDEIKKTSFSKFVIVDSQPCHNELFQKFDYDVIIDHALKPWLLEVGPRRRVYDFQLVSPRLDVFSFRVRAVHRSL